MPRLFRTVRLKIRLSLRQPSEQCRTREPERRIKVTLAEKSPSTTSIDKELGTLCQQLEYQSVQLEAERGARIERLVGNLMTVISIMSVAVLSVASPILDSIRQFCGKALAPQIMLFVVLALIVAPLVLALFPCVQVFLLQNASLPAGPQAQFDHFASEAKRLKDDTINQMDVAEAICGYLQPVYNSQHGKNELNQKRLKNSQALIGISAAIIVISTICFVAVLCSHL